MADRSRVHTLRQRTVGFLRSLRVPRGEFLRKVLFRPGALGRASSYAAATAPDHGDMTSPIPERSPVAGSSRTALGHAKLVG